MSCDDSSAITFSACEQAELQAAVESLMDQRVTIQRLPTLADDGAGADVHGAPVTVATDVKANVALKSAATVQAVLGGGLPGSVYWQICVPLGTDIRRADDVLTASGKRLHIEVDATPVSLALQRVLLAQEVQP